MRLVASDPQRVLAETRDHLRRQALALPGTDEWREAFVGIAEDLDIAIGIRNYKGGGHE